MNMGAPAFEADEARFHHYPGASAPDRQRTVNSGGIALAVYEWGDIDAPPLILVHGAFDFARTFDVFAPLLADAGYRVVSYASNYAMLAVQRSNLERPITICARELPDWLSTIMNLLSLEQASLDEALQDYAAPSGPVPA